MIKKITFLLLASSFALQGCVPAVIGIAGVATGASILNDRRTTGSIVDDHGLELKISQAIAAKPLIAENSRIVPNSYNGNVLLTGEAFNEDILLQAEQIAKNMAGVKSVENQVVIGRRSALGERAYDAKQTAKVKAALLGISLPNFDPTRVKVVTEHGKTYLMGLLSTQEAQAVVNVVRRVSDVKEVISLFEIVN